MKNCPNCDHRLVEADSVNKDSLIPQSRVVYLWLGGLFIGMPIVGIVSLLFPEPYATYFFFLAGWALLYAGVRYVERAKADSIYYCSKCSNNFKGKHLEPFSYYDHYASPIGEEK